ncbi:MAG TPA: hypothetical protein VI078_01810, partial [bacterium]
PSTGHAGHYNTSWNGSLAEKLAVQPADTALGGFKRIWSKGTADADGVMVATAYNASYQVQATSSGCNAIDCHNNKNTTVTAPNDYRWYGANQTGCVMCHVDATTESSHVAHTSTATRAGGGQMTCPTCHNASTAWGIPGTPPATNHLNGTFALAGGSVAFTYQNYNYPSVNGNCGVNVCHNNGRATNADSPYTWGTTIGGTNSCVECHGNTVASMNTGAHTAHLNASTTFGDVITCADCHGPSPQTVSTHANGTLTFSGVAFTYGSPADRLVQANGGSFGTCGTNVCHNNGLSATTGTPNNTAYSWNTTQVNCTLCHQDGASMTTNAHNEHLRFATAPCTVCHAIQTASTHINLSVNFTGALVTYSLGASPAIGGAANGSCRTTNCHNNGTAVSALWNTTGGLACDACHYYAASPTSSGNTAYVPPLSRSHNNHFDKGKVCATCHGTLPTSTAHINYSTSTVDAATATYDEAGISITGTVSYNYSTTARTCTSTGTGLGCHATGTPDWDLSFSNCTTYCHSNTTTVGLNPRSGLHNNATVPTISHESHDDAFSGTVGSCTSCHNVSTATAHADGAFATDVVSQASNEFHLNSTMRTAFNDTAFSCSGAGVGVTGCHDGAGDAGSWARIWSTDSYLGTNDPTQTKSECGGCHGTEAAGWNFGTGTHNATDNNVEHSYHWNTTDTAGSVMTPGRHNTCKMCHGVNDTADAHPNYSLGGSFWRALDSQSYHGNGSIEMNVTGVGYVTTTYGCNNAVCHDYRSGYRMESSAWTVAARDFGGATCRTCHGYPPTSPSDPTNNLHASGVAPVNHDTQVLGNTTALTDNHDECSFCHGMKGTGGIANPASPYVYMATSVLNGLDTYGGHTNGSVELNGGTPSTASASYQTSSGGCASTKCHGNDAAHQFAAVNTTSGKNLLRLGAGKCTSCHDNVNNTNAPQVAIGDPHTKLTRSTTAAGCDDCHPGGNRGATHSKKGDANVVAIKNAFGSAVAGWTHYNHTVDTGVVGYVLGGNQTSGTTEAEICWNCHDFNKNGSLADANEVSEWGTNTQTNGLAASANYNFGTISTMRWRGSTWNSAQTAFAYKVGTIQSIHTANTAGGAAVSGSFGRMTETPDAISLIRCSYCHNVHFGTNGGGSTIAKPFLRGTWKGSPYPEDGAPFNKNYTNKGFGSLPRGGTAYTEQGGYFIDENNPNLAIGSRPTSTNSWALGSSAGLCTACHTTNVNTMDYVSEAFWYGTNGHANAVIGGTGTSGTGAADIFDFTHGRPMVNFISSRTPTAYSQVPDQGYLNWKLRASRAGYGYRGSGGMYAPRFAGQYNYNSYNWGAVQSSVSTTSWNQNQYHQFPCSKCHNPHASRLPKLLITNCLDINHAGKTTSNSNAWGPNKSASQSLYTNATLTDRNKYAPYWEAADNCHRANDDLKSGGWNKVSPWGGAW